MRYLSVFLLFIGTNSFAQSPSSDCAVTVSPLLAPQIEHIERDGEILTSIVRRPNVDNVSVVCVPSPDGMVLECPTGMFRKDASMNDQLRGAILKEDEMNKARSNRIPSGASRR